MDNTELEQTLRGMYYDPERLYQKALRDGLCVTRKQVKEWLKSQVIYTRYKQIRRKDKFRQTVVY